MKIGIRLDLFVWYLLFVEKEKEKRKRTDWWSFEKKKELVLIQSKKIVVVVVRSRFVELMLFDRGCSLVGSFRSCWRFL